MHAAVLVVSVFGELQRRFVASGVGRWYYQRERNEQVIIACLACVIGVSVLWLAVWKPVSDWRAVEDNRYRNAQSTLDWMQANEAAARTAAAQQRGSGAGARALLPTITSAAQLHGLTLNRVQPESNGAVSVMLKGLAFGALLTWLGQLQSEHEVVVQRIAVDAEEQPGYVNAQVRLQ